MKSSTKTLINNTASLGIVQIVNYVFPLITIPYVSRIIGPDGFGVINYATAFVSYFILIINFGFDFTATRKIASNPNDKSLVEKTYSEVFNARLLLFLISIPLYVICLFLFPIQKQHYIISLVLFLNVFSALLTPQYLFQGLQKLAFFSRLNLLKAALNTLFILLIIKSKDDLVLYVAIGVGGNFLIALLALLYVRFALKLKFRTLPVKRSVHALWSGRFIFYSSIVFSLYTTTNIIILGLFDSTINIGYYTTAVTFINIVQNTINIPLSSALYPYIGRAFSEGKENGMDKLKKILPITFYFNLLVSSGILILSPFLIVLVFGEKFEGSIIIVQILSLLPFISGLSNMMGIQTMLNLKMDKLFLKITSLGAFLSIILNLVFGYLFGYTGTACSYLLTETFIVFSLFLALKKKEIVLFDKANFKLKNIYAQLSAVRR
ncbi:oligosaccharide flippase family protein [Polluticaenibacter yanchengensis]|uniref:Oligosaccharide flippase family protein n=1 Tax=Polluticaenibacter yanchengensis TaxID=3014562 RepID=A0ABT4UQD5_9BACT|nr:oligosaccharide flippase family protein [Chitinophagaceae bacterium LY-5]